MLLRENMAAENRLSGVDVYGWYFAKEYLKSGARRLCLLKERAQSDQKQGNEDEWFGYHSPRKIVSVYSATTVIAARVSSLFCKDDMRSARR